MCCVSCMYVCMYDVVVNQAKKKSTLYYSMATNTGVTNKSLLVMYTNVKCWCTKLFRTGDEVVSSGDGAVTELHSNKEEEKMKEVEEEEQQQQLLPYLDEGIVTNILIKVHSAESLVKSLRYVCKLWSNIIFHHPDIHLNSLLPSKPPCLIVQHLDYRSPRYIFYAIHNNPNYNTCFVKMGREGVVEQHFDLTPLFTKLLIRACANGLMLVSPSNKLTTLCVVNPLTNHRMVLPPIPVPADVFPALASVKFIFLPSTQNYKVLMPVKIRDSHSYIYVLTLSSSGDFCQLSSSNDDDDDNDDPSRLWRIFNAPIPIRGLPLAIDGVMYWSTDCHGEGYYILSFDVTSEIFYTTPHNLFDSVYAFSQGIMDMGGYIAVWFVLDEEPNAGDYTIDVHVMKDLHRPAGGARWKEVYRRVAIDPGFVKAYMNTAAPSVGNGEVIIFRNTKGGPLVVYNFKSQQWWQVVGNNLTLDDRVCFYGYHVENMPVPFDSLFSLKQ